MSKVYDEFTGAVYDYDPKTDIDEWIVCSIGKPGHLQVGHSCHFTFPSAKLAQIRLLLDKGIDAWIEHIPAVGPRCEVIQLDAVRRDKEIAHV